MKDKGLGHGIGHKERLMQLSLGTTSIKILRAKGDKEHIIRVLWIKIPLQYRYLLVKNKSGG